MKRSLGVLAIFALGGLLAAADHPETPASTYVPNSRAEDAPDTEPLNGDEARAADADWYAEEFGVSHEEALRRLIAQETLDPFVEAAQQIAGDRFAGAWIEHEPEWRQVIALTGDGSIPAIDLLIANAPAEIEISFGARWSYADLLSGVQRLEGPDAPFVKNSGVGSMCRKTCW